MSGLSSELLADRPLAPEAGARELERIERSGRRIEAVVDGVRIVWRVWGQGAPVVLLHGGFGAWSHWARNVAALSAEHTVLAVDIPGFGDSDVPPDTDPVAVVNLIWRSLDAALGGRRRVTLVGFSFGGAIGGQMAALRPDQIERLVFVGSSGMKPRPESAPLLKWRKLTDPAEIFETHRQNLGLLMLHDTVRADPLAVTIQAANTRATRVKSRSMSAGIDLNALLTGTETPLAGIWGKHDVTAKGHLSDREAMIRGWDADAEFHVVPDAGHWVQYEAADEVNRLLLDLIGAPRDRRLG
jgi:pimeloyl-ACP methyl ester carboxylesterase